MKKLFFFLMIVIVFSTTFSDDYLFPSQKPPADKKPEDVKQYICLTWDKNTYSGLNMSLYEPVPDCDWKDIACVGGKGFNPWDPQKNPLNIEEGDMGVSWAVQTLAGTRKNPDNSPIHFTFNVTSGHMVEIHKADSKTPTGYKGEIYLDPITGVSQPVCWGREQAQIKGDGTLLQPGYITQAYDTIITRGHEIGNNTLDFMEYNSPLPQKYFPNNGEGFNSIQGYGWLGNAGRILTQKGWEGTLGLGDAELKGFLDVSIADNNLFSFQAPWFMFNSNMLFALKALGYSYTGSFEEGWEKDKKGCTFYWPYTTDNGSENVWTLKEYGEQIPIDSMPTGVWVLPLNTIIVPEDLREAVWNNGYEIFQNAPDASDFEDFASWDKHGKLTASDLVLYYRWGMTTENWLATMKYNLDERIAGYKAPFNYNCWTDCYSIIHDNEFLLSNYNASSYGLSVTNGWNTWDTRIKAMEDFVDYALGKACYFKAGIELINEIKEIQKDEVFGNEFAYQNAKWNFYKNTNLNSSSSQDTFTGTIDNVSVTVDKINGNEKPDCGFVVYENVGWFTDLDHVAVTYKTTAPLLLKLIMDQDEPWEVLLNNLGPEVYSGRVPLAAFHYNKNNPGNQDCINKSKIKGIAVQPLTVGDTVEKATFSIRDVTLYSPTSNIKHYLLQAKKSISIHAITHKMIELKIGDTGKYSITMISPNGRTVAYFMNIALNTGINKLPLNNLSKGMYFITIRGKNIQRNLKAMIL